MTKPRNFKLWKAPTVDFKLGTNYLDDAINFQIFRKCWGKLMYIPQDFTSYIYMPYHAIFMLLSAFEDYGRGIYYFNVGLQTIVTRNSKVKN